MFEFVYLVCLFGVVGFRLNDVGSKVHSPVEEEGSLHGSSKSSLTCQGSVKAFSSMTYAPGDINFVHPKCTVDDLPKDILEFVDEEDYAVEDDEDIESPNESNN